MSKNIVCDNCGGSILNRHPVGLDDACSIECAKALVDQMARLADEVATEDKTA